MNLLRVTIRGIEQPHKLQQVGATPTPATNLRRGIEPDDGSGPALFNSSGIEHPAL